MSRRSPPPRLLSLLATDLAALFPVGGGVAAVLAPALLLLVAYWYLGAPGSATPRDPAHALRSVLWALLLLGLIPYLLARALGLDDRRLGLGRGDGRLGRQALLIGLPLALPAGYLAASDAAIRQTYPWPGAFVADVPTFAMWAGVYSIYYLSYEFFFRGFLLRGLEPFLGRHGSLWLQTVAATMLHFGKPLTETIAAFPASLLFGLVALRTRSLYYVIAIHLLVGLATDAFSLLHPAGVR